MDPVAVYAIGLCGGFGIFFIARTVLPLIVACYRFLFLLARRSLAHRFVVDRHSLIGPWTVGFVLAHLGWLACNVASVWVGVDSVKGAASRTGRLALINMAPLFLAMHLSVLADLLGLTLDAFRLLHRSCGYMAASHVLTHGVLVTMHRASDEKRLVPGLYESLGAGLLLLLLVLLLPVLRRRVYEVFLRFHQALAVGICFCAVKHVTALEGFSRIPLYIFFGVVCSVAVCQAATVAYRNKQLGAPGSRLDIKNSHGSISGTIQLSRPLRTDAGQYINIWVPSVSFLSSHPFMVTSWSPSPQREMEIFMESRRGFTRRLAGRTSSPLLTSRVFLSGPHGRGVSLWGFGGVVLFASGFGVVAMLPILRKLMYGCRSRRSRAARTHLIWQIGDLDLRRAIAPAIDDLLDSNSVLKSDALYVSIYNGMDIQVEASPRRHFTIYPGKPNVGEIIRREAAGDLVPLLVSKAPGPSQLPVIREDVECKTQGASDMESGGKPFPVSVEVDADRDTRTLVLVSASGPLRDEVRRTVGAYLLRGFELRELDWQPDS